MQTNGFSTYVTNICNRYRKSRPKCFIPSVLLVQEEEEQYDAQVFQKFLINVLDIYPKGKIVMVLDNARIHHAKLIQPFLQENKDRLKLFFLPPYSPNLNPIEGLWKWLKNAVIYNVFIKTCIRLR